MVSLFLCYFFGLYTNRSRMEGDALRLLLVYTVFKMTAHSSVSLTLQLS